MYYSLLYTFLFDVLKLIFHIDLATTETFATVFADEIQRLNLTTADPDLGDLHPDTVYNDYLLLDGRCCQDPSSPFFLQWFMAGDTMRPIRFVESGKNLHLHLTDVLARLDIGNDRNMSYYKDIWRLIQENYMGGSWMKLLERNKALSMNGNDYLLVDAVFRLVALHLLRHLEVNNLPIGDFEVIRVLYTLRSVTHPNTATAPLVAHKTYLVNEPPIITIVDDNEQKMLSGFIYINYGTTRYIQVGIWTESLTALHTYISDRDGDEANVRVWAYKDCNTVLEQFIHRFAASRVDQDANIFARDNFAAYEYYLKTFFEEQRADDTFYIKEWVQQTGVDIEHEIRDGQIFVNVADMVRLFCRLANRKEAEMVIRSLNPMLSLHDTMQIIYSDTITASYPIPKLIAPHNHDFALLFQDKVGIVEVDSSLSGQSTARNMTPNDFLELRRLELQLDPGVRIAECNAREAEARAQEAQFILEKYRLERERRMVVPDTPKKQKAAAEDGIKKRKIVESMNDAKGPPRCTIFKIPKRLAAKMATANIIRINNQDRKAHTKTNDRVIIDAIDHGTN